MPEWLIARLRVVGSTLQLLLTVTLLGFTLLPSAWALREVNARFGIEAAVVAVPAAYALWGVCYCLVVIVVKWAALSRPKPGAYPFFSMTVVRWACINVLAETANQMFIRWVIGTDFIVWWYRLLGAKIGRNVTIATVVLSDWDLIEIGDDVFLGGRCTVIGHVGEMGRLKFERTIIRSRCTVGQEASVFPGVVMEEGAVLGAHALATKGMHLQADSIYGGVPARLIKRRSRGDASSLEESRREP